MAVLDILSRMASLGSPSFMINPDVFAIGERQIKRGQRFSKALTSNLTGAGILGNGSLRTSQKAARAINELLSYTSKYTGGQSAMTRSPNVNQW
jgi:hypothetical protein